MKRNGKKVKTSSESCFTLISSIVFFIFFLNTDLLQNEKNILNRKREKKKVYAIIVDLLLISYMTDETIAGEFIFKFCDLFASNAVIYVQSIASENHVPLA